MVNTGARSAERSIALGDVPQELDATRRMLTGLPGERWDWKPHPKSWSLGELTTHLVNLLNWQLAIVRQDGFDLASAPWRREPAAGPEPLLEEFEQRSGELRAELEALDEEALHATWTLRQGEEVILQLPRAVALRSMGISHMVHHRAQLGVYRRLLDAPVPGMYGPSADEAATEGT